MDDVANSCPTCTAPVAPDAIFCIRCGTKVSALTSPQEIDSYVRGRIEQELKGRLVEQGALVSGLADQAEGLVWTRITRAGWIAAPLLVLVVGLIGYLGVKTYGDTIGKVRSVSENAIKQVQDASAKVQLIQSSITSTAAEGKALKSTTDRLSEEVQAQAARLKAQGGEVSAKIAGLDREGTAVQSKLRDDLEHAANLSKKLDGVEKSLSSSAAQVAQ